MVRSLLDAAGEVLSETLVRLPYNSAVAFHEYVGGHVPDLSWGASCAWQSFHAGGRISELTGLMPSYLPGGRHVAAVFVEDEHITVIDPYLLHLEPIRLNRGDDTKTIVDAYPLRHRADGTPAPSRTSASWSESKRTLRLEYTRFSPSRGHHMLSRAFTLRLARALAKVPPPTERILPLLTHPEQNNLSIRTVHPVDRQMRELVLPLTGSDTPGINHLITKDNQGAVHRFGTAKFNQDLDGISAAIGHSPSRAIELLLGAADLYRRIAPANQKVLEYRLTDD